MIFDDDDDIQSICAYILQEEGWTVSTHSDCSDLIGRITDFNPSVILMDNWIPDDGGVAATQSIKNAEQTRHIPVVYFSANSDIESLSRLAGADMYLAKPFDLDLLTETVDQALRLTAR